MNRCPLLVAELDALVGIDPANLDPAPIHEVPDPVRADYMLAPIFATSLEHRTETRYDAIETPRRAGKMATYEAILESDPILRQAVDMRVAEIEGHSCGFGIDARCYACELARANGRR